MENQVVNLHDKLQKLIEQYSQDKKKLEELSLAYDQLKEENSQLMHQIETITSQNTHSADSVNELNAKIATLETKCQSMQSTLDEFEKLASAAITKIDELIPSIQYN